MSGHRIEISSETWKSVVEYLQDQEASLMSILMNPRTEPEMTQFVRGQIHLLHSLIDLPRLQRGDDENNDD